MERPLAEFSGELQEGSKPLHRRWPRLRRRPRFTANRPIHLAAAAKNCRKLVPSLPGSALDVAKTAHKVINVAKTAHKVINKGFARDVAKTAPKVIKVAKTAHKAAHKVINVAKTGQKVINEGFALAVAKTAPKVINVAKTGHKVINEGFALAVAKTAPKVINVAKTAHKTGHKIINVAKTGNKVINEVASVKSLLCDTWCALLTAYVFVLTFLEGTWPNLCKVRKIFTINRIAALFAFGLEAASAVLEQISNEQTNHPKLILPLLAAIFALLSLLLALFDMMREVQRSSKWVDLKVECLSVSFALAQTISSLLQFIFIHFDQAEYPIRFSFLPLIFALIVLISSFISRRTDTSQPGVVYDDRHTVNCSGGMGDDRVHVITVDAVTT